MNPQLTAYEVPETLFSMVLDDEFTIRGGLNALTNPAKLSPKERDTVRERMKVKAGNHPLSNALIDVAMNPWVWASFIFSPVGGATLGKGAAGLLKVAPEYGAFVRKSATVLQSLGLTTGLHVTDGTPAQAILFQALNGFSELSQRPAARALYKELDDLMRREGLPSLSLDDPRLKGVALEKAKAINNALVASLDGLDRVKTRGLGELGKNGYTLKKTIIQPLVAPGSVEPEIQRLGLAGVRDAMKNSLDDTLKVLYGKDDVAHFVPDPDKISRVWRSLQHSLFTGPNAPEHYGAAIIRQVMGEEFVNLVREGKLNEADFGRILGQAFSDSLDKGGYFPRNVSGVYGLGGEAVTAKALADRKYHIFATKSSIPRVKAYGNYHPKDLQSLHDQFGLTQEGLELHADMRKALGDASQGGGDARFLRVSAVEGMDRYMRDSARTYAWFVQKPDASVIALQRETLPFAQKGRHFFADGTPYETVMDAETKLRGGWSLADAAEATHKLMANPYARTTFSQHLIPMSMGMVGPNGGALTSAVTHMQSGLRGMLDGWFGSTLKSMGSTGQGIFKELERRADPELLTENARLAGRGLSSYLYTTHLGANVGSMVMNSMQPWLLAANWLGVKPMAKGYRRAMEQLVHYAEERAKLGAGPLTPAAKEELYKKVFRLAGRATGGEDVLGISPDAFRALDDVGASGLRAYERPTGFKLISEYLMKGFEKIEALNRVVVGEAAVEALAAKHGIKDLSDEGVLALMQKDPLAKTMVHRMGLETQFANNPFNSLIAFSSRNPELNKYLGFMASPLMRQFMNFPVRSALGAFVYGPRLGGGVRKVLGQEVNVGAPGAAFLDFARGMGVSSVIYSVGQNMFGADLSRALYASSVTDLVGQRFSTGGREPNPFPVPPAVQIPLNIGWALMNEDSALLKQTLPRLVPGGVGLAKAIGVLPQTPPPISWVQKTYADYKNPDADGNVPVYKDDGTLIDYQPVSTLMLRAMGGDFGKFSRPGDWANFVLKNQDEIQSYKQKASAAMITGDVGQVEMLRAEFQKRFGAPLVISREALRSAVTTRSVPRLDRIVGRMPQELQPQYEAMTQEKPQPLGGTQTEEKTSPFEGFGGFSGFGTE